MSDFRSILLDFFQDNIRRMFWGIVVAITAVILWWLMDDKESAKVLAIGVGTFALTQFRGNLPRPNKEADDDEPKPDPGNGEPGDPGTGRR